MRKSSLSGRKSQDIGKIGQKSFGVLCANAGLICNESLDDLAGWDFLVQFHLNDDYKGTLDNRPPSLCAFFQVKTSLKPVVSIGIKLSNAERMVTEIKPTFFAIGKLDKIGGNVSFVLGHLGSAAISFVLKELRKFQSNEVRDLNRKKIYLPVSDLELEDVSVPDDIVQIIKKYSKGNIELYIKEKIKITKTVGLKSNSYQGTFSVAGEDADDKMIALMIGEIKEIEVTDLSITETRFDIAIKKSISNSAFLSVEFSEKTEAILVFYNNKLGLSAEYRALMRIPAFPGPEDNKFRVRLEADLFAFSLGVSGGISNWVFNPGSDKFKSWSEIRNNASFARILMAGFCEIDCFLDGSRFAHIGMKSKKYSGPEVTVESLNSAIDAIDLLYANVVNRSKLNFSLNEFFKFTASNHILYHVLASWRKDRLKMTSVLERIPIKKPRYATFILPLILQCGGRLIAVAVVLEGTVKLIGRDIEMMPKNVYPGMCGSFEKEEECISYLYDFAKSFCAKAPDGDFIVVDEYIFSGNNGVDHLLSL